MRNSTYSMIVYLVEQKSISITIDSQNGACPQAFPGHHRHAVHPYGQPWLSHPPDTKTCLPTGFSCSLWALAERLFVSIATRLATSMQQRGEQAGLYL